MVEGGLGQGGQRAIRGIGRGARDEADSAERASHTAQPRSAFGGTVAHLPTYPPQTTTTTEVQNGGGIYRGLSSILESE